MIRQFKKLVIAGMLLVALVGCSGGTETTPTESPTLTPTPVATKDTTKTKENSIKIAMRNPKTLHPLYNTDKSVEQALHLLFSTLVNIEEDGSVSPNIATAWSLDSTKNILTVELRKDSRFHDNTPVTAQDVAFSLETIKKVPESPYKPAVANVVSTEVVDDFTINIIYKQPFSGMLQTLFFPIVPKHLYDIAEADALKLNPIGSGPYKFQSSTQLKDIMLEANEDYFKGKPNIAQIEVMITPDEESSLYSFEQGLIDVVYTDIMDWGKYAKDKSATIYELYTNCYEFMGINFNKTQFQNKNVRQAMVYALDRNKIVEVYYLGHGLVADTPINPASYLADKTLETVGYDKEQAKFLLIQEGYQKDETSKLFVKNGIPLSFNLLVSKENKERVKVAGEIQKMYKEIGIQVNVEQVTEDIYLQRVYTNQFDAFLGGWKLSYIPDLSFAFHSSQTVGGENFINYKNEQMDTLLRSAFVGTPQEIQNNYSRLQAHFKDQNPYISLYFRNGALIAKKQIKGNIKPLPTNIYANIEEWNIND